MLSTRLISSALTAFVVVSLTFLTTACTNPDSGLDGSVGVGGSATLATTFDRTADFTGFLVNHTGHAVILRSAKLLPIQGFRVPKLVHEAIEPGLNFATSDRDWPPTGPRLQLKDFAGYRIPPGHKVNILYAVVARKLGVYADAGLEVTVLVNGGPVTVDVVSFAGTCIVKVLMHSCSSSFQNRLQKASNQ